ncbi:MAG: hypothetical protein Q7S84_02485 [bacterium]|nr:hypothetical protein [bacterium]
MAPLLPRTLLYGIAGLVAVSAGISARAYADRLDAAQNSPGAALNPSCTASAQCLTLTCGGQSFVVASDVPFGTVERIRESWCGGVPIAGGRDASHCSYYGRCVIGPEPVVAEPAAVPALADLTELDVREVRVYPNVASAIIEWEVSAPAKSKVTVVNVAGGTPIVRESGAGAAMRHMVQVTGLVPNGDYTYTVDAMFRAGVAARATGSFHVLPKPPAL